MSWEHLPLVALVGRPSVGKSTLFNRMVGRRQALVDAHPGVTRDRLYGRASYEGHHFRVVDTGGLVAASHETLLEAVRGQTLKAIAEADLVLLVVDGAAGLLPADGEIAPLLRRAGKPVVVVANKLDAEAHAGRALEFYALGFATVLGISAEHARGCADLLEHIVAAVRAPRGPMDVPASPLELDAAMPPEVAVGAGALAGSSAVQFAVEPVEACEPECDGAPAVGLAASQIEWGGGAICMALVGRPNAGKSSLINRLLGQERLLTTPLAGTTRDPVDTALIWQEQPFCIIDTAGIRRKRSIEQKLERCAVTKAFQSMDRADVVVMVLDATQAPSEQDARIVGMAHDKGKGLIVVANKWDLLNGRQEREDFVEQVRQRFAFAPYAPLLRVSAKSGAGIGRLLPAVVAAQRERHRRVHTGELNRFFREVVDSHPPPSCSGRKTRLYFVSQPLVGPPTFVFSTNSPQDIQFAYERYLQNALRARYGFTGTPLWLKFRPHSRSA